MKKSITDPLPPGICKISRLSTLFMSREMTRIGFGTGQFFMLSEIYARQGLSQDELSLKVGVDKSNTSRALTRLEKYGLIKRTAAPENHKEKRVFLTQKALDIQPVFRNIQRMWNNTLLEGFSDEEKTFISKALNRMLDNAMNAVLKKPADKTA